MKKDFQKYVYNGNYYKALKRDDNKCVDCKSNFQLLIHHINRKRDDNNINNLITLCRSCHALAHNSNLAWKKPDKTIIIELIELNKTVQFMSYYLGINRQRIYQLLKLYGITLLPHNSPLVIIESIGI